MYVCPVLLRNVTSDLPWADAEADVNSKDLKKDSGKINIKDIVWPGGALKPPEGIPEKRFVRVTFLEEDPYVMLGPPTTCAANKGIICQVRSQNQTEVQLDSFAGPNVMS